MSKSRRLHREPLQIQILALHDKVGNSTNRHFEIGPQLEPGANQPCPGPSNAITAIPRLRICSPKFSHLLVVESPPGTNIDERRLLHTGGFAQIPEVLRPRREFREVPSADRPAEGFFQQAFIASMPANWNCSWSCTNRNVAQ